VVTLLIEALVVGVMVVDTVPRLEDTIRTRRIKGRRLCPVISCVVISRRIGVLVVPDVTIATVRMESVRRLEIVREALLEVELRVLHQEVSARKLLPDNVLILLRLSKVSILATCLLQVSVILVLTVSFNMLTVLLPLHFSHLRKRSREALMLEEVTIVQLQVESD
jgi:hypothetical protein